jgi:hypothetical protein
MRGAVKLGFALFALAVLSASAQAADKHSGAAGGAHAGKGAGDALGAMHSHGGNSGRQNPLGLFGLNGQRGQGRDDDRGGRRDSGGGGGNGAAIGQAIGGFLGAVLGR